MNLICRYPADPSISIQNIWLIYSCKHVIFLVILNNRQQILPLMSAVSHDYPVDEQIDISRSWSQNKQMHNGQSYTKDRSPRGTPLWSVFPILIDWVNGTLILGRVSKKEVTPVKWISIFTLFCPPYSSHDHYLTT